MSFPKNPTGRIDEFDGLRGLLALWVACSHILCWCGFADMRILAAHQTGNKFWQELVFAGGAVDTFMILSGFVIAYLLHHRPQSHAKFITGRFFRIYPVYLVCLLFSLPTIYFIPFILNTASWHDTIYFQWERAHSACELAYPASHLLAHLTLLFGMIPDALLPHSLATILTPAWSISLEWQFYLVAPLILFALCSRTGIFILGTISCSQILFARFWGNAFLPNQLPLFLVGIGSFHLYANQQKWQSLRDKSLVALAVIFGICVFSSHWIALSVWTLVFVCRFTDEPDIYSRWLRRLRQGLLHPWLQFTGRISYPLYLIHWPIILVFMFGLLHWMPEATSGQAVIIMSATCLPVILGAAFLLHQFVEIPLMQFGKSQLFLRRPAGTTIFQNWQRKSPVNQSRNRGANQQGQSDNKKVF